VKSQRGAAPGGRKRDEERSVESESRRAHWVMEGIQEKRRKKKQEEMAKRDLLLEY